MFYGILCQAALGLLQRHWNRGHWGHVPQDFAIITKNLLVNIRQWAKLHAPKIAMLPTALSSVFCLSLFLYSGKISQVEYSIHHEWFDWLKKVQTPKVDLLGKLFFALSWSCDYEMLFVEYVFINVSMWPSG